MIKFNVKVGVSPFINREQAETHFVDFLVGSEPYNYFFSYVIEDTVIVPAFNTYLFKKKDAKFKD